MWRRSEEASGATIAFNTQVLGSKLGKVRIIRMTLNTHFLNTLFLKTPVFIINLKSQTLQDLIKKELQILLNGK